MMVIDDLGRQRVAPIDLFNRWIVPLEEKQDFLALHSGQHISVPFDVALAFSTNLNPLELAEWLNKFHIITDMLATLNDNEKEIIALRFGLDDRDPQTLDTIGRQFGVTRERIRQIEAKSLEKLRLLLAERDSSAEDD